MRASDLRRREAQAQARTSMTVAPCTIDRCPMTNRIRHHAPTITHSSTVCRPFPAPRAASWCRRSSRSHLRCPPGVRLAGRSSPFCAHRVSVDRAKPTARAASLLLISAPAAVGSSSLIRRFWHQPRTVRGTYPVCAVRTSCTVRTVRRTVCTVCTVCTVYPTEKGN